MSMFGTLQLKCCFTPTGKPPATQASPHAATRYHLLISLHQHFVSPHLPCPPLTSHVRPPCQPQVRLDLAQADDARRFSTTSTSSTSSTSSMDGTAAGGTVAGSHEARMDALTRRLGAALVQQPGQPASLAEQVGHGCGVLRTWETHVGRRCVPVQGPMCGALVDTGVCGPPAWRSRWGAGCVLRASGDGACWCKGAGRCVVDWSHSKGALAHEGLWGAPRVAVRCNAMGPAITNLTLAPACVAHSWSRGSPALPTLILPVLPAVPDVEPRC